MATTGVLWPSFYSGSGNDGSRIRKWLYGSVLVRDWDAAGSTNMANIKVFGDNGHLNPALLQPVSAGGYGFYDVGSITENGVEFSPQFSTDETVIWQSRRSQRTDITKDDEEIMFAAADSTPLVDYLYNNLPIGFTGVPTFPTIGTQNYSITRPFYSDVVYRQLLIIGVDGSMGAGGQPEYMVELRPRVTLAKKNKRQWGSKQIDVHELTFTTHVDPYSGWDANTLRGGVVWYDEGGPVTLPVGVPGTVPSANTATINPPVLSAFAQTSGGGGFASTGPFYWVVTATTAAGETVRSNEITGTMTATTYTANLTWAAVTGATGYKVYRGTTAGGENALITTIGSGATVTYNDTGTTGSAATPASTNTAAIPVPTGVSASVATTGGLQTIGTDYYKVTAITANGETSGSAEVTAVDTTNTSVNTISWTAVTGATGYKVYVGSASGAQNTLVTLPTTTATSFADSASPVVATAAAGKLATLVFNTPISPLAVQGYTFTVTQSVVGSNTYSAATVTSTTQPSSASGGPVTVNLSGLTAGTNYIFQVVATAPSGLTASYSVSNSITALA